MKYGYQIICNKKLFIYILIYNNRPTNKTPNEIILSYKIF